jgi:L-lactate dehydrogenase (cytochrome)
MVGQPVAMPVAIAPTGLTGMQHADGEILAARAAKAFGIPFTLSTMSICSIEDVAKGTDNHPFWFQLYVMRDRDFIERLIDRAKAPAARRWCSRWTCRSSASATRTSRTACRRRPS